MSRGRAVAVVVLGLACGAVGCDDQPDDGKVTKQEVKETLTPKADAGLKGAKSGNETLGVQTMNGIEVAQHPALYHGQTLRSSMRLVDQKEGVATFAADEGKKQTISLRLGAAGQRLGEMQKDPGAMLGWLSVTYTIDEKIEEGANAVGELKDVNPATPPQETGPGGVAK